MPGYQRGPGLSGHSLSLRLGAGPGRGGVDVVGTFGAAVGGHAVCWRSAWNRTVATCATVRNVLDILRKFSRSRPFISAEPSRDMTGRELALTVTALDARGVKRLVVQDWA